MYALNVPVIKTLSNEIDFYFFNLNVNQNHFFWIYNFLKVKPAKAKMWPAKANGGDSMHATIRKKASS